MRRRPRPVAGDRAGFVLVGVLMFILVLTILGLTLFSLSSYESQFFVGSLFERRSFESAMSGVERAQFVMARTGKLADAQDLTGDPIPGVIYTIAKQGDDYASADSTGTLVPNGPPVWIRALAVVNGKRSLVEARYTYSPPPDFYKRLFTLSNPDPGSGLVVNAIGVSDTYTWPASPNVYLYGEVWQNSTDSLSFLGNGYVVGQPPSIHHPFGGVTSPDVGGYIARFPAGAQVESDASGYTFTLDAYAQNPSDHIGFFRTVSGRDPKWSLDADPNYNAGITDDSLKVTVRGTCIWLFDHGLRSYYRLDVSGSGYPDDALIIVAAPGSDPREAGRGIVLLSSLRADAVPVILVTNGGVKLEQQFNRDASSSAPYLSVYALNCVLTGPEHFFAGSTNAMTFYHPLGSAFDQPGGLIDRLSAMGYLPNATGGLDFQPIVGTWREIKDTDGLN